MDLLLIVLIILLIVGAAGGFAFHVLWIIAVVCLIFIAARFFLSRRP